MSVTIDATRGLYEVGDGHGSLTVDDLVVTDLITQNVTLQTNWYQDYVHGSDKNPGTQAAPVQHFYEIVRRYQASQGVSDPTISSQVTINVVSSVPASYFADPLSVLFKLRPNFNTPGVGGAGNGVTVKPVTPPVKRSSALTSITNPFSRTAAGRLVVADSSVADWSSDVSLLFHDKAAAGSAWVCPGSTSGSILTSVHAPVSSSVASVFTDSGLGALVTVGATDAYEIIQPVQVYFGSGGQARAGPGYAAGVGAVATGYFYFNQLWFVRSNDFEWLAVYSDSGYFANGCAIIFGECRFDQYRVVLGNLSWAGNCFLADPAGVGAQAATNHSLDNAIATWIGGGAPGFNANGTAIVDQDFVVYSGHFRQESGYLQVGNVAIYTVATDQPIQFYNGKTLINPTFDAGATMYGYGVTSNQLLYVIDSDVFMLSSGDGSSSFASTFLFNCGVSGTVAMGSKTNVLGFGFSTTPTGSFVGPTTASLSRADAALAPGTGFGGTLLFPPGAVTVSNQYAPTLFPSI